MSDSLEQLLERLREEPALLTSGEEATRQGAVLPLLGRLGWDRDNIREVVPEYTVGNGRVDYCLRIGEQVSVFVEVKRARGFRRSSRAVVGVRLPVGSEDRGPDKRFGLVVVSATFRGKLGTAQVLHDRHTAAGYERGRAALSALLGPGSHSGWICCGKGRGRSCRAGKRPKDSTRPAAGLAGSLSETRRVACGSRRR